MIKDGRIGVSSTDTIYGIIGSALNKDAVSDIYKLKERENDKPFIVLISSYKDLLGFNIKISKKLKSFLKRIWPGKVTVILGCPFDDFYYLHRGKKSIAFRMPKDNWLRNMIKKTGPLVAPSANKSGMEPALTIEKAKEYFGERVSFYIDKGINSRTSSIIIELKRV
jgi:L-threonylcarbamoyladenylate synthase